jgi:branched-chain amino acid transport system substrate-binding protein
MAYFAYNSLGARTAVVLSNQNVGGYKRTAEFFAESFRSYGGFVTAFVPYSEGEDFADLIGIFLANPPDVIFCPEDFVPASRLVNAAYEAGLNATNIIGSDAWDGVLAYVYRPEAMKNVFYSATFSFDDPDPAVTQFVRNYFDSFSQMPISGSATAYTCMYILAEAIKKAGNTDKDDIISAMKTNELDLITGHLKFDENNNPRTNLYIIQIENGIYTTYEKLSLPENFP